MSSMRSLIDLVESPETTDFITFAQALRLDESATAPLTEGAIADKINAVTKSVHDKYGDIQYAFLAKATMKAMNTVGGDTAASAALQKILKVGKFAIQNRALLSVLLGLVGTLVGIASHPGGAQAATQIDHLLTGNGVDDIIKQLHQSGIDVGSVDTSALPQGISATVAKAAKALKAIDHFKFAHGQNVQTERFTDMTIVGDVTKDTSTYHDHIRVTTPDGKIVLADIDSTTTTINGQTTVDEKDTGVEFRLLDFVKGSTPQETEAAQAYLDKALSSVSEAGSGVFDRLKAIFTSKADDLSLLVSQAVVNQPPGKYRVTIGAQGVSVQHI